LGNPGYLTSTASSDSDFYEKVEGKIESTPDEITGLQYQQKGGVSNGVASYQTITIPFDDEGGMERAFRAMENLRKSGQKFKQETIVPKKGKDLTSIFN